MRSRVQTALISCLAMLILVIKPPSFVDAQNRGLSAGALKNMTYRSEWTKSKKVKLVNGRYSEPQGASSAIHTAIMLADEVAYGKLNGRRGAAVILLTDPGGSGTFYDLAAVVIRKGKPVNVASVSLGDRIKINALTIQGNSILVDMMTQGAGTPMISPSRRVVRAYTLKGNALLLVSSKDGEPSVRLSGTRWRWVQFRGSNNESEAIEHPDNYTIEFMPDARVSIRADCNRGSGTYKGAGNELSISIFALSRAACPPESLADRYIRDLNEVGSYLIEGDRLSLNLKMDGATMIFGQEE